MKKLVALLLAVAMLLSFAACGEKEEPNTSTEPAVETDVFGDPVIDMDTEETEADATEAPDVTAAPDASTDPDATTVPGETANSDATTVPGETAAPTTAAPAPAKPTTTAEIITLYNNAVNSAYNAKAGFYKERYTDNEKMNASAVLNAFKDLVYQFMGVGAENKYTETVTKGKWESDVMHHYLRKSTLTAADVTKATCTLNGDQYMVVIDVKPGSSKGSKDTKFTNAPIDKCGICVGNEDKGYYDHKTGEVIYDAIGGTYAGAKIDEKYSNAKITAVIDAATGNIVKLAVVFDINVAIDIGIGSGTATATTHVIYKNFKY